MKRDWNAFFEADDFYDPMDSSGHKGAKAVADFANKILREELEKTPVVYGGYENTLPENGFRMHENKGAFPWEVSHQARLVDVRVVNEK